MHQSTLLNNVRILKIINYYIRTFVFCSICNAHKSVAAE